MVRLAMSLLRAWYLAMPIDILFDFASVHVIGDEAAKADLRIDFTLTDLDETWTVWVNRGVLNARRGASPDAQFTVAGPKAALVGVVLQPASAGHLAQAGRCARPAVSRPARARARRRARRASGYRASGTRA
jgi:alkyl sulfatase BDS1-like metallo-beta-lactamase superfamily hydrolase